MAKEAKTKSAPSAVVPADEIAARGWGLPEHTARAESVIAAFHDRFVKGAEPDRFGLTLGEYLARNVPGDFDRSLEDLYTLAEELKWGERKSSGQLVEEEKTILKGAFYAYCGWLQSIDLADHRP